MRRQPTSWDILLASLILFFSAILFAQFLWLIGSIVLEVTATHD